MQCASARPTHRPNVWHEPLRVLHDAQVDKFLHTYRLDHVNNVWSGERGIHLNTTEWRLLHPQRTSFTSQDDFLAAHECETSLCNSS
jgi:hypothetical protein